jgi:hypothetical protein
MRWLCILIAAGAFTAVTGSAYLASAAGWGLPGQLEKPVSIRDQSLGGRRHGTFLYFGTTRRHFGGGFHGGK